MEAKEWLEAEELDKCEHACMQAEIEMMKGEKVPRSSEVTS